MNEKYLYGWSTYNEIFEWAQCRKTWQCASAISTRGSLLMKNILGSSKPQQLNIATLVPKVKTVILNKNWKLRKSSSCPNPKQKSGKTQIQASVVQLRDNKTSEKPKHYVPLFNRSGCKERMRFTCTSVLKTELTVACLMPFACREISEWLQSIHKHKIKHRVLFVHSAVFVTKIHISTTLLWHAHSQFQPIAKLEIISNNQYQDQTLKLEMCYRHFQQIVVKNGLLHKVQKLLETCILFVWEPRAHQSTKFGLWPMDSCP